MVQINLKLKYFLMMINVNKIGFDENVQVVSNTQWSVFHRQGAT